MAGTLSTTKARHYPALPSSRFPELIARLAAYRGGVMTQIAVELSLLTFVRSSELRFARWMSSTSINLSGEYLQNEKKLKVCVTRTVI